MDRLEEGWMGMHKMDCSCLLLIWFIVIQMDFYCNGLGCYKQVLSLWINIDLSLHILSYQIASHVLKREGIFRLVQLLNASGDTSSRAVF